MADHAKPDAASNYSTGFFTELNARFNNLAKQALSGDTNLPTGAIQWNSSSNKWEVWSGAAWGNLAVTYAINVDQVDGYHAGNSAGQVPVSNGTVCATLNADKHDGYDAGNSNGQMPINNGTLCTNLNADLLDGAQGSQYARLDAASNFTTAPTISGNTVWHAGIDGALSGMDADMVDGYQTSTGLDPSTIAVRSSGGEIAASRFAALAGLNALAGYGWNQNQSLYAFKFYLTYYDGSNAAGATMYIGRHLDTSRSINAGGTINASGADYAEYERKSAGCGVVAKGDIIGFDSDGMLTDRFDRAISFGIKSTDPSYVGGDTWGNEEALAMRAPTPVTDDAIERELAAEGVVRPHKPAPVPLHPADAARVMRLSAARQQEIYERQSTRTTTAHRRAVAAYEAAFAARQALRQAEYDAARAPFEAALEAARQRVDRVAYSGKVPCNVLGAQPGDYIVPAEAEGGGITGRAVPAGEATFDDYRRAVGQVRRILPDGRAEISVKVG